MALVPSENAGPGEMDGTANTHSEPLQSPPPAEFSAPIHFEPEMIAKLPGMTSEQLLQIEELLSHEFNSLAKEYLHARESRVESMLDSIDRQIQVCQARDSDWSQHYASEMEIIDGLLYSTENHILGTQSGAPGPANLDEFDKAVADLVAGMVLPIAMDDVFTTRKNDLPFSTQFRVFVDLYQRHLDALLNYKDYQSKLVDNNTEKNRAILWKQYRIEAMEFRQKLIDQTYLDLRNLYEEYHGINEYKIANIDADKYYRAGASVDLLRHENEDTQYRLRPDNVDSYYDVDNRYVKNNRIQVTAAKEAVLERAGEFERNQEKYSIPQIDNVTVRLSGCEGLTSQEADADLLLLRKSAKEITVKPAEPVPEPETLTEFQDLLDMDRLPSQMKMEPIEL